MFAFDAFQFTGSYPPDSCIAVSDDTIFVGVNGGFALFDKSGNKIISSNMSTLFGASGQYFDPRCQFDGERFIVISAQNSRSPSYIAVAISTNKNPKSLGSEWRKYRINVNEGTNWCDYPTLDALSSSTKFKVTCNMFTAVNRFSNTLLFEFDKNNPNTFSKNSYGGFFTMHPINKYIIGLASTNQFIIYNTESGAGSYINKKAYPLSPVYVPQKGSSISISPGDTRVQSVSFVDNKILVTHHTNINGRTGVVVYEIDPKANLVTDTIEIISDVEHYFFPCVLDKNDVIFNIGSDTEYIGVGRWDGTTITEYEEATVAASRSRYGDYSSCAQYENESWYHTQLPASREWKTVVYSSEDTPGPDPEPLRECIEKCLNNNLICSV